MHGSFDLTLTVILFFSICKTTFANYNLYVSKEEVNRTLGITAVLKYVEKGVVSSYASDYPVIIKANIDHLVFMWKNYGLDDIKYELWVTADDEEAVRHSTSITRTGNIPRQLTPFTIFTECTGRTEGEVKVLIHFNVYYPSKHNATYFKLNRRKLCRRGRGSGGGPSILDPLPDNGHLEEPKETTEGPAKSGGWFPSSGVSIFYIAIGCICAFILLLAFFVVSYFSRIKKPFRGPAEMRHYSVAVASPGYHTQTQPFLMHAESPSTISKYSELRVRNRMESSVYSALSGTVIKPPSSAPGVSPAPSTAILHAESRAIDLNAAIQSLTIDQEFFQIGNTLLEGTFGRIACGTFHQNSESEVSSDETKTEGEMRKIDILIKAVKRNSSETQRRRFLEEGFSFYGLRPHPNLSQVAAVIMLKTQTEDESNGSSLDLTNIRELESPLLCYAHDGFGNLKKFLQHCRGLEPGASHALSTQDVVYIGLQIIRAMIHLHKHRVLHNDVAARNCLIGEHNSVQLCDTSLSRDLFPGDYHCLGDNENRPVKWMAPEALLRHQFTSATDVWAFGVTMWELLTGGQQPYSFPDIDPEEVGRHLLEGYRLPQPYNCPDELYGVIYCCWSEHAVARPNFDQLLVALEDFYTQLTEYI